MLSNFKKVWLKAIAIALLLGVSVVVLWIYVWPRHLTALHGREMAMAVSHFREVRQSLTTRLEPERILTVATRDYLPWFLDFNATMMCEQCDRFWVVKSAEVRQLRVTRYSDTRAEVRAEVVTWGHMVEARTHERMAPYEAPLQDSATYVFVREHSSGRWLLQDMKDFRSPNLMNPSEFTLDDLLLFDFESTNE